MTLVTYTPDKQKEVLQLLGLSGPKQHIDLLFKLGDKYGLDILTKEISLIPGKGPFIGVWGRLHIAHRSGKLDGLEMDDEFETDRHHCVRVVVWRKDMARPAAKVIGRVGKHEGSTKDGKFIPKEWPLEIARSRGLRAALGFAFSIHDAYDPDDDEGGWVAPPDQRVTADGAVIDVGTGEITAAGPAQEVNGAEPAAAPKRRRTKQPTPPEGEATTRGTGTGEVHAESERLPGTAGGGQAGTLPGAEDVGPAAAVPDHDPPTVIVGGHTLAQHLAMAARDAGIDDDTTRHEVIEAATGGAYKRGSDIPDDVDPAVRDRLFAAFAGLANGTVELRYDPGGQPRLVRPRRT